MKKLLIIISLILYWALLLLNAIINKGNLTVFIFYMILFLPLTLAIIKNKDMFALFIIILYETAECLMSLMFVGSSFIEIEESSIILIITQFIIAFYSFSMIVGSVKILRNKENTVNIYIIGFACLRCVFAILNFIINKDFTVEIFLDLFSNISFIFAISLYLISLVEKEINILIKE